MSLRRSIPSLAVLLVMIFVVWGGYLVSGVLSQPAGPAVTAGAVRLTPLSGWEATQPGSFGDLVGVELTRGNADLGVYSAQIDFGVEVLLTRYVTRFLEPGAQHLSVSNDVQEVKLGSGLTGLRVSYVGTFGDRSVQVEGEVTAVVSPSGTGAIFDAWGPTGLFGYARGDTREMIDSAEIG